MKKVRKLSLNKETVRHLTNEELKGVAGGATHNCTNANTCPATCPTTCDGIACNPTAPVCQISETGYTCGGATCP